MIWRQFSLVLAFGLGATACDRLPFIGGDDAPDSTATAAVDTVAPVAAVVPRPAPAPVQRPQPVSRFDEPWTPTDTGTVAPGMFREDVIAVWGAPVAERVIGGREYLYFRNGCEVTCGTFDVVFLDDGAVVDVIARGPGHTYAGTSSSPVGRMPSLTLPATGVPTAAMDSTFAEAH